ncbi:hypothetical protein P170DRAFT_512735 [Aspergillus steynii IBT 23096]|uniref:USP domain-containing protein n=1 Tax=Aspergillus steynii IBT 23096 TaxID=1392250 RepID=A0A2I2FZV8_9EURO|nr:uncharacterized protein P170DRAFT_512735 [Aspergillus steynii IBT 23096]PLB46172.1 hypothetical protein P170DRAFT_512735 [Aspergillus steynii IBT 23096]
MFPGEWTPDAPRAETAQTALHNAALSGDMHNVLRLLGEGVSPNTAGGVYGTPLQAACIRGHEEVAFMLLYEGADVNAQGGRHGDALRAACFAGHVKIVELLIDHGARVDAVERYGPLYVACEAGHLEIVSVLLERCKGVGVDVSRERGRLGGVLDVALHFGDVRLERMLRQKGVVGNETKEVVRNEAFYGGLEQESGRADDYEAMMSKSVTLDSNVGVLDESYYTWEVDYTRPRDRKASPVFHSANRQWRAILLPDPALCDNISLQLELLPTDGEKYIMRTARHCYDKDRRTWGPQLLPPPGKLIEYFYYDKQSRNVDFRKFNITVYMRVFDPPAVEEGLIFRSLPPGLNHNRKTRLLKLVLQILFHINPLRRVIQEMLTDQMKGAYFATALEEVLFLLEKDLSTAPLDPHSIEQVESLFIEMLTEQIDDSALQHTVSSLLKIHSKRYDSSLVSDTRVHCTEETWHLSLRVRGNRSLSESLQDLIQPQFSREDARVHGGMFYLGTEKGLVYEKLPPVLSIHLQRSEYEECQRRVRYNDYFEYPEEIDMIPYLSMDADRSESWVYTLFGVIVYDGNDEDGVYYGYLRTRESLFIELHDDAFRPCTVDEVLSDSYGGNWRCIDRRIKYRSACILYYCRISELGEIVVDTNDTSPSSSLEQDLAIRLGDILSSRKDSV